MTTKIYILTHKDNSFIPHGFNKDIYEIINMKQKYPIYNRIFCEYCGMHYIYKNNIYSDYIGFCHYRRHIFECSLNYNAANEGVQVFYKTSDITIKSYLDLYKFPDFIYNDVKEFITIYYPKFIKYLNTPFNFYNRMIYFTNYETFVRLAEFIEDYINFIKSKYKINNEEDFKDHVIKKLCYYYRENFLNIDYDNGFETLFYGIEKLHNVFNPDCGFNGMCNVWRIYAYIIEMLIPVFLTDEKIYYNEKFGNV